MESLIAIGIISMFIVIAVWLGYEKAKRNILAAARKKTAQMVADNNFRLEQERQDRLVEQELDS